MRAINIGIIAFFVIAASFLVWQLSTMGIFNMGKPVAVISNHNIVLEKMEELGKLELVKYKFKDVLEHTIEYDWYPDSKAVLIISGEAVGCIDLKKIKQEDIDQSYKDSIYIRLPEPELCYYKINHNESRIYDSKHGLNDAAKLVGEAYKEAEKKMKVVALETGILEQTKKNAEIMLKPLFESISKKKVFFTASPKKGEKTKTNK
jgi:hypothetical protein